MFKIKSINNKTFFEDIQLLDVLDYSKNFEGNYKIFYAETYEKFRDMIFQLESLQGYYLVIYFLNLFL